MWLSSAARTALCSSSRVFLSRPLASSPSLLYRYYATAPITTTPPTNKSTEDSKTKKRITVEEQIAQLQKSAEARQGVFEIETPKLYPPPQGGVSGARRRRRLLVRRRQREEAHRLTRHQRPTSNAANINPRHLSLPPAETKPKYPTVVIPRLRQIDYEKVENASVKKA